MQTIAVTAFILFIIVYAQRNWFGALCALIVFTALKDYPSLPNPMEAKGVNHWSIMLLGVTAGWIIARFATKAPFNIPKIWLVLLGIYLCAEFLALGRLCLNLDVFRPRAGMLNRELGNYNVRAVLVDCAYGPIRFLWMSLLLLDGARTRKRILAALASILAAVTVYALVVNKEIPLSSLAGDGMKFRHRISKWTNRNPNDLARVFAAGFWVLVLAWETLRRDWRLRAALAFVGAALAVGLGHMHSRGGYVGWFATGVVMVGVARSWRVGAVLAACCIAVMVAAPSITDRLLMGFDTTGGGQSDVEEITAGRNVIWPAAMQGIDRRPIIGYGAYGYVQSDAFEISMSNGGGELHPHNAYLETLLDHGYLLGLARLAPFLYIGWLGYRLSRRRGDPVVRLAGLVGAAWVTCTLTMGVSGQHFGLTENLFTFWCVASVTVAASMLPAPARGSPRRRILRAKTSVRDRALADVMAPASGAVKRSRAFRPPAGGAEQHPC
jgi:hypothetical protein